MAGLRALISVSDKKGIAAFAEQLVARGFEIISSGGTHRHLSEHGIAATKVSDITGFPEILDGRVKTLNPRIHAALLARYELSDHRDQLSKHGIDPIHLVVVNLYPFQATVAKADVTLAEAVEQIDIGGPAMIRAAAKNFKHVFVITDPVDYEGFLNLRDEDKDIFRLQLARKAFDHTAAYDACIADYLDAENDRFPPVLRVRAERQSVLRYGENPHQEAALYTWGDSRPGFELHQGKALSYNNLVDMDAAWRCAREFEATTAVIVKHTNPCGVGQNKSLVEAFIRARKVDPVSAFGGVIALNSTCDEATAEAINENFAEIVVARSFTEAALSLFRKKKNLRVISMSDDGRRTPAWELKRLESGLLVQNLDDKRVPLSDWRLVSKAQPKDAQLNALQIAWQIVIHVKSNAIVYASEDGALGIGAGQMSRVDSARIAVQKASEAGFNLTGSAMASDAFFPFRDSIDAAAAAGVRAVVEPGGSIRDEEVIRAADEHGMVLFFTDTRHFKH
ncbi:MAG: bifunctional phosphoribosylaminoimidazolecarboxamide formyltransferase/IMP cyclohydrolase [Acidobacteria bacterium]|nr:bifunctional phosphoribosylaminoimidazolecarboxamide formyltransferase/IMP cyclohydrolase [Acidobacteriota bacterium]